MAPMLATPPDFVPLFARPEGGADAGLAFVFRRHDLLVREADLALPDAGAHALLGVPAARIHPVGRLGALFCAASWVDDDAPAPAGHAYLGLRALFGAMDETLLSIAGRAHQIAEWARTHRFCGACGTPTVLVPGERCARCPACGHSAYPRISPAMMVLVKRGEQILLARHSAHATSRYTALAGFLEAGESVEDAIHREVYEEVGLYVTGLRYFASQSWPFPHSLMLAFTAEYAGGELRLDPNEIAEARWFGPGDALPDIPSGVSIAYELVTAHLPRGMTPAA